MVGMPSRGNRSSRSSGGSRSSRGGVGSARPYQRTVRVNESMREVIAEALEELDDDRLNMVTITGIDVDPDFGHAVVFYSALFSGVDPAEVKEAFDENRVRFQAAVGRQIRLKRTPLLAFRPDPAIAEGVKIEEIIRNLPHDNQPDNTQSDNTQSDESSFSAKVDDAD